MLLKLIKSIAHIDSVPVVDDITPQQFFWLYTLSSLVLLATGWFLLGWLSVLFMGFFLISNIIDLYKHKDEMTSKATVPMMLAPLFITIALVLLDVVQVSSTSLIDNKAQAQVLTGIVPSEHEYVSSRRSSRTYLNVNGTRMHCDIDNHDACELIYAHAGKTATIHHYDGLAYEIEIDGQQIYEFNAQVAKFNATKSAIIQNIATTFILYGIPALIFFFICIRVARHLFLYDEMDDEPAQDTQDQDEPSAQSQALAPPPSLAKLNHKAAQMRAKRVKSSLVQSRIGAGGWAWRVLFGAIGVPAMFLLAVFFLPQGNIICFILSIALMVGLYYLARLPLKNAKAEVDEYHQALDAGVDVGELGEFISAGFYNHMGVLSWMVMYVCGLLTVVFVFVVMGLFTLVFVGKAPLSMAIIALMIVIVLVGVMSFVIKHAIKKRDAALE